MAQTKLKKPPMKHNDPGKTRSLVTKRVHRRRTPARWNTYDVWHIGGLTPWTRPGKFAALPVSGPTARAMKDAIKAWREAQPLVINLVQEPVPSLQTLARRKIPGLARYYLQADGSF